MICSVGKFTYDQDHLLAFQTRIKEADDSIADLKDKNAALQKEVTFSLFFMLIAIVFVIFSLNAPVY